MEQEDKKPIDLKSLSLEERKELAAQLKEEERQEKERKQNETKVLQELTEEVIDKNIDDCLKVQGISNDFILKLFPFFFQKFKKTMWIEIPFVGVKIVIN